MESFTLQTAAPTSCGTTVISKALQAHAKFCHSTQSAMKKSTNLLATLLLTTFCIALTIPLKIEAQSTQPCALDVIVQSGDTLSLIAGRTLNDQGAYQRIINATNARAATDSSYAAINDANALTVGWKLCIPGTGSAEGDATSIAPVAVLGGDYTADKRTVDGALGELPTFSQRLDPDGVNPLTIAYLRKQSYPGSPLTVEQSLEPGANYNRYIVSYRSEGLKIYALMTLPVGARPPSGWPVILFVHGYVPPAEYSPTERYEAYVDAFASQGYIVLRPDLRGHGNSEGVAIGAYGSPDYTIDLLNALASVKQYGEADASRIGIWGHSMGGYLTLRAMVVTHDVKAAVIWSGVVASYEDMFRMWSLGTQMGLMPESVQLWGAALLGQFGTPEANPLFWQQISANSYLGDLSGPIQLHHGSGDTVVPSVFSNLLLEEIVKAGGKAQYYQYAGDDHSLSASFDTAMGRSIAFFDTYVKNAP